MSITGTDVFVYTGPGGSDVPQDVVRVVVDPSVTSIPAYAFDQRKKLNEVELCEGLVEIGEGSFDCCGHSITRINIPSSLRRICDDAFRGSLRTPIRLHDGIESIGEDAFAGCIFTNFRVPPLITVIPSGMLMKCMSTFSVEIPELVTEIGDGAFAYTCYSLRNVAFPPNAVISNYVLRNGDPRYRTDLMILFGDMEADIIRELKHRFDGLLIHKLVYYQTYNQGMLLVLHSQLDPTGNNQDCLGMTPLHILACSSVHDLEVYRVIIENYPANLITEDRWGATPLLYAFWGAAPDEIIQFLVDSYQLLYPGHQFNWTMMVKTIGKCDAPKECIERLLHVKQMNFSEQTIDWDHLLDVFVNPSTGFFHGIPLQERMQFLVMCGMTTHVEAVAFKLWRDCIISMILTANFARNGGDNLHILHRIRAKLAHFEDELDKLKYATTMLELALWKMRINDSSLIENATGQKKIKTDEWSIRQQCLVACGADVVIGHMLPFLINTREVEEEAGESSEEDY
jgi:hypothetical protein